MPTLHGLCPLSAISKRSRGLVSGFFSIHSKPLYLLLLLIIAGCTQKKKFHSPAPAAATDTTAAPRQGNSASQWVDRTAMLASDAAIPAAAEDCAMIYDPVQYRIVLFGGKDDANQTLQDVWALDLAQNLWQKLAITGEQPPASEDHAVIYDPVGHRMILHGGEDGWTTNKLWALDLQTPHWRNMTDSTSPAREDHSASYDSFSKRMVIFGGQQNDEKFIRTNLNDLWALNLDPTSPYFEKWQNLTSRDEPPPGRGDHVAVYDEKKNRLVIYGGWDRDQKLAFDDTWAFYFPPISYAPGRWKQLKTRQSHPPARRHAAGVYDSARNWFVIFGGFGHEGYLNDVWAFDLENDVWLNLTPGPQPRLDHQAIFDPRRQRLVIYGGDAKLGEKFHDLWELQIHPNLPLEPMLKAAGAPPAKPK